MSTIVLSMASPNSLKRTYEEAGLEEERPGQSRDHQHTATPAKNHITASLSNTQVSSSPFPSAEGANLPPTTQPAVIGHENVAVNASNASTDQLPKKTKLTFAEKEARRVEKELKDQQKAEERAKKEEERVRKEKEKSEREEERLKKVEEKRVKDEKKRKAKEERDRLKEEEKAKKDEERQKKEEEKNKKTRVCAFLFTKPDLRLTRLQSQLRLNAFFGQPSLPTRSSTASPGPDGPDGMTSIKSRRSSVAEVEAMDSGRRSRSTSETPRKPKLSDYERAYPPFFVQSNTTLAPSNRFARDEEGLSYVRTKVDEGLQNGHLPGQEMSQIDLDTLLHLAPHKRVQRYKPQPRVKDIVARIDGAAQNPIDLTGTSEVTQKPSDLLKSVPMKFLKFHEDVRPPYIGTFTRIQESFLAARIARNPFHKSLPEANYDYDSEAEWEDPGEGEDLDSEGEEELDEEDEGEMEGFLDDEEATDARAKRRPLLGDLEPTCTGICWAEQNNGSDLSSYAIDMLIGKSQ